VVIAANIDQVLVVLAARQPPPRWGLVDRVLISARVEDLAAAVCINKWDEVDGDAAGAKELDDALAVYSGLGFAVFRSCALRGDGLEDLESWMRERVTVLSGHSGVGKSTILNALCPGARAATGEVSGATGKGRHVTTAAELHELRGGGYLADTPGYRQYGVVAVPPAQLALYYPELEAHVSRCRFKDCLHRTEPDCAVLAARARGEVSELRYRNYLQILESLEGR
jgi:ribosome biogenesis GTPase